jgi:Ankyrin repeat
VEELLKEGVDVNSIDLDGRTAMHIAACEGHLEVVKLLLQWRANVNARDRWGSTVRSLIFLEYKRGGGDKIWDHIMVFWYWDN